MEQQASLLEKLAATRSPSCGSACIPEKEPAPPLQELTESVRQERDALLQEKEEMSIKCVQFAKRHDAVLEQLQNRGKQLQKLHSENQQIQHARLQAERLLSPVQRTNDRLVEDKKFLEKQLSTMSSSLEATQKERDSMFDEKTTVILTLQRTCEAYQRQLQEMGTHCDSIAIENARVADEAAQGVDERRASGCRNVTLKLQTKLEDKERECADSLKDKVSLESSLRKLSDENAELKLQLESLQKQADRRSTAPLEVTVAKLSAQLETTKQELSKAKQNHGKEITSKERKALQENEARMVVTVQEVEKKLAKSEKGRQRALREVLKAKNQVDILEEKLVKALSPVEGLCVMDILKQNAMLESEYRCLIEEQDEKEAEQIQIIQKAFLAKKSEFETAIGEKQAEIADHRMRIEDLCRERNSLALELQQQQRAAPKSTQPEMDKLLREFRDAKRNLQHDKDCLEVQMNELRQRERELLEKTESDRERLVQLNQKYTAQSMELQATHAKTFSQANVVRYLEELKRENAVKIQQLQDQIIVYKTGKDDSDAKHRIQDERIATLEREQNNLQTLLRSKTDHEVELRQSHEEQKKQFQLMFERLKIQHCEERAKCAKQEELKFINLKNECDFAKQEMERLEMRNSTLEREGRVRDSSVHTSDVGVLCRLKMSPEDENALKKRIANLEDLVTVRTADCTTKQQAIDCMQQDNNRLQEECSQEAKYNEKLRLHVAELEEAEKKLKDRVWETEKQVENHKERADKSLRWARMSVHTVTEMKRSIEAAEKRASDLEAENGTWEKLVKRHKTQSAPSEQHIANLVGEVTKLREEKRVLQGEYRNETESLRAQLTTCEPERVEALEQSIADYEDVVRRKSLEISTLAEKTAEQQKELETITLQLSLKEQTVHALQSQMPCEALESMVDTCKRDIEQSVTRLGQMEMEQRETEKLASITSAFELTLQRKENEIEEQKTLVRELQNEREEMVKSLEVKDAVTTSSESLEMLLSDARNNYAEAIEKEEERNQRMGEKVAELEKEISDWTDKYRAACDKMADMNLKLHSTTAKEGVSSRQIDAMEQTVSSLNKAREDTDARLRQLHSQFVQLQSEKRAVEMDKELADEKASSLTRRVSELISEKTSLEEVEAVFQLKLENARKEYKDESDKIRREHEESTRILKDRVAEMETELQTVSHTATAQKEALVGEVSREKETWVKNFEQKLTEEQAEHALNISKLEDARMRLEKELVEIEVTRNSERDKLQREKLQLQSQLRTRAKENEDTKAQLEKMSVKEKEMGVQMKELEKRAASANLSTKDAVAAAEKDWEKKLKEMETICQQANVKYQTKAKELQKELDAVRKQLQLPEAERKKMPVEEGGGGVASKVVVNKDEESNKIKELEAQIEKLGGKAAVQIIAEKNHMLTEKIRIIGNLEKENLEMKKAIAAQPEKKTEKKDKPEIEQQLTSDMDGSNLDDQIKQARIMLSDKNKALKEMTEKYENLVKMGSSATTNDRIKELEQKLKKSMEETESAKEECAKKEETLRRGELAFTKAAQKLEATKLSDVVKKTIEGEGDKVDELMSSPKSIGKKEDTIRRASLLLKMATEKLENKDVELIKKQEELQSTKTQLVEMQAKTSVPSTPIDEFGKGCESEQIKTARQVLIEKNKQIREKDAEIEKIRKLLKADVVVPAAKAAPVAPSDDSMALEFEKLKSKNLSQKIEQIEAEKQKVEAEKQKVAEECEKRLQEGEERWKRVKELEEEEGRKKAKTSDSPLSVRSREMRLLSIIKTVTEKPKNIRVGEKAVKHFSSTG